MRGVLAIVLTTALLMAVAFSTSGAEPSLRASAVALLANGIVGPQARSQATGTEEHKREDAVHQDGVTVDNGETVVRTSTTDGTAYAAAAARTVSLLDGRVTAYGIRR